MTKEQICIDLSQCTQGQRKNIYKTLVDAGENVWVLGTFNEEGDYDPDYPCLAFSGAKEWVCYINNRCKTVLSYTAFINFFKPKQTNPFKVGDKVYCSEYGWGEVESVSFVECTVKFSDKTRFVRTSYLSFTEYTMQGFTQERPIDYEQMAKDKVVGWFWDGRASDGIVKLGRLTEYKPKVARYKFMNNLSSWEHFCPLTPEEKAVLEKNEFFNEIFKK